MDTITGESKPEFAEELKARARRLREQQPKLRARNVAEELEVSEGELLACHVGDNVTRLADDAQGILQSVLALGEVMALTRNESCVHERKGVYDNGQFFRQGAQSLGLFLNPDIDLRLFMDHWKYGFAAREQSRNGVRKSLQFFDQAGQAIHKIYLTSSSDEKAYENLVSKFRNPEQDTHIETRAHAARAATMPDEAIDWEGLRHAWENLKDTHDFHEMLHRFQTGREQAFRHIGRDFAYQVDVNAPRHILELVRDQQCEMMVFVGNQGCLQIHTGPVHKLVEHGPWYNVLDPMFNLHLREDQVAAVWVTKKPTEDGIVTALEIFDADSELIATFFGKRKPGIPELPLWREIIAEIPATTDAVS